MFRNVAMVLSTCSIIACGGGGSGSSSLLDTAGPSNEQSADQSATDQSATDTSISQTEDVWTPEYCSRPPVSELGGEWTGTLTFVGDSTPICAFDMVLNIDGNSANDSTCDMTGDLQFTAVRPSPDLNILSCEQTTGEVVDIEISQTALLEYFLLGMFTPIPEGLFITADIGFPLRFTPVVSGDAPAGDDDINSLPVPYSSLSLQLNNDGTITGDPLGFDWEGALTKSQ